MRSLPLLVTLLLAPTATAQEPADTHPPAGVRLRGSSGARLFEASVPGQLLDWVTLVNGDSERQIYLLAAVEKEKENETTEGKEEEREARCVLYRADLDDEALIVVREGIDCEFDRLVALDLDADGDEELLVGRPGEILQVTHPGSDDAGLEPLFSARGVDLASQLPVRGSAPQLGELALTNVGLLRRLGPTESGWGRIADHTLPTRATPHRKGLRLTTPPSTLLRLADGDLYATGPESSGNLRLRTVLLSPDENTEPREVWSRLPGLETVQWSWFHTLDGRPMLIVTTNSADKLGIFERQKLRVYPLVGDRTLAGVRPKLEAQTSSRRWQEVKPFILDLDDDGDDDLVVAQYDGLGGGKVKIEAFLTGANRRFETRTRSTVVECSANGWHFGEDLTGDGLADLVLVCDGDVAVYPGLAIGKSKLVDKRPRWSCAGSDVPREDHSVELSGEGVAVTDHRPDATGTPALIDLDGDGRSELLLAENPRWGFGRLRVVYLP